MNDTGNSNHGVGAVEKLPSVAPVGQLSLGPWTQDVGEAIQSMGAIQRTIKEYERNLTGIWMR